MDSRDPSPGGEATRLLAEVRQGRSGAMDRLMSLLYDELRDVADRQLRRERPGHTLRATGLVHEAWVKMAGPGGIEVKDRSHFLAIAARAMRQILVDHARRRGAEKRGGDWHQTTLGDGDAAQTFDPAEILALDAALDGLEERQRRVVEYRFFGGMEEKEIAEVLQISERTVRRDWAKARAHLYRELYPDGTDAGDEAGA